MLAHFTLARIQAKIGGSQKKMPIAVGKQHTISSQAAKLNEKSLLAKTLSVTGGTALPLFRPSLTTPVAV